MNVLKRTEALIDLKSLESNFLAIRRYANDLKTIAVIKADAYGHGALSAARLYEKLGADILAVACLDEALSLRMDGIRMPIIILGITPPGFTPALLENNIIQTVHNLDYAKALDAEAGKLSAKLACHIKLDTGMSRIGIYAHGESAKFAAEEAFEITELKNLSADGIFTHFAEAESADTSFTDAQFESFSSVLSILKSRGKTFNFCHCANSATVVNYKRAHLNCIRPGLILYGYSPMDKESNEPSLSPALTLKSMVVDIKKIRKGDTLSYNRTFAAERDMTVAVVSCGYADGLPRSISNRGAFLINGCRAPIVGRVCMDLTIVDITDIPDVSLFSEVVIIGRQKDDFIGADELARWAGTIPYEILTSISKRVPRTYI